MPLRRAAETALAGAVAFVVGAASVLEFAGDDLPVPPPASTVLLAVGVGLLAAAGFAALVLVLKRRNQAKRDLIRRAVRTGRLPDTDDALLRRVLWERLDQLTLWRWSWIVAGGIQLLLSLSHLLSATDSVCSHIFRGLELALWIGIIAVWTARAWWERPKVLRLLVELDDRMAERTDA